MTQELLTALGAGENAEFGIRNSELPVGDGLPDVPQPRSGDRQRAVEGASPYGADPRFPVGALHEAPADAGRLSDERAVEGASPYEADRRSPVGDGLPDVPQPRSGDRQRAVEGASPYGADPRSPVGALHEAPADTGRLFDERAVEGASPYEADRRFPVGEGLAPPADAGADPTTGGASPAPTETGEAAETGNSEFRIPHSALLPDSASRDPHSALLPDSAPRVPNSELSPDSQRRIPPSTLPPAPDLRAHFDALWAASERLAAEFDDFDPEAALRDPDFLRLTAPGLGVEPRRAWLALHPESLQRRTADALRRSLASVAARPREGGRGGALPETDYRSLSRAEQQRLKERIHRAAALGEKIYP